MERCAGSWESSMLNTKRYRFNDVWLPCTFQCLNLLNTPLLYTFFSFDPRLKVKEIEFCSRCWDVWIKEWVFEHHEMQRSVWGRRLIFYQGIIFSNGGCEFWHSLVFVSYWWPWYTEPGFVCSNLQWFLSCFSSFSGFSSCLLMISLHW